MLHPYSLLLPLLLLLLLQLAVSFPLWRDTSAQSLLLALLVLLFVLPSLYTRSKTASFPVASFAAFPFPASALSAVAHQRETIATFTTTSSTTTSTTPTTTPTTATTTTTTTTIATNTTASATAALLSPYEGAWATWWISLQQLLQLEQLL